MVLSLACLVPGLTATAQASPNPGWRVVKTIGPANGTTLFDVVADSPGDAWATGATCYGCGHPELLIEHWNGSGWAKVAGPSGVPAGSWGSLISAASATEVWVAVLRNPGQTGSSERLLHLSGHHWTTVILPANVAVNAITAFTASDAWIFGAYFTGPKAGQQYNLRYTGHSLRSVKLPAVSQEVSAVSASDIWTSGQVKTAHSTSEVAMHWNGTSWTTIKIPLMKVPAGATENAFVALGVNARQAWAEYNFSPPGCCQAPGLLHWDSRTWQQIVVPRKITSFASNVVPDGRGGIWLEAGTSQGTDLLYDYREGRWTRFSLPAVKGDVIDLLDFAWIPGGHSVWAVSSIGPEGQSDKVSGVVLKYGP
jgi:hypothetical protein